MTTERMADMQARQQLGAKPAPPKPSATLEHALMAARARVFSASGVDGLRALVADAGNLQAGAPPLRRAAVLYAGALAAAKLRDADQAAALAQRLAGEVQADPVAARHARLLAAEIALAAGRNERAAGLVSAEATARPDVLLWAQARLGTGGAREVAQRLQSWVAQQPRDATAWQLLAAAYGAQGQQLRAIRAEAEAQVAHLDYAAAIDRFKAAQELVRRGGAGGDHIEASIIDTRTREVESLLREQALER
jgi:predicted Zn-dependent protease